VSPAGRRPGPTTTDSEILAAARTLFGRLGYRATTIRAVAEAAGVNQSLVRHFFGSKQELFVAALRFPPEPLGAVLAALAESPREQLGERLVTVFVRAWRDPETSQQIQAVFRSAATDEQGAVMARRMAEDLIVPAVSKTLQIEPVQVAAAMAQLLGFAFLSAIVGAQPLAGLDEASAVALLAPSVQHHLDASHETHLTAPTGPG
jgi:AcrR family transcriptional regulator